jgi:hypothetical protein
LILTILEYIATKEETKAIEQNCLLLAINGVSKQRRYTITTGSEGIAAN